MIDICPICGGKLGDIKCLISPPLQSRKCSKCGRSEEVFWFNPENDRHPVYTKCLEEPRVNRRIHA